MRDSESHHICLDCSIDDDSINQWRVRGASGNGLSLLHPLQSWFSIRQNSSVKRHRSSLWNAQPVSADRCHLFADQLPPLSTAVLPTGYKSTIVPNGYERRVHRWLPLPAQHQRFVTPSFAIPISIISHSDSKMFPTFRKNKLV